MISFLNCLLFGSFRCTTYLIFHVFHPKQNYSINVQTVQGDGFKIQIRFMWMKLNALRSDISEFQQDFDFCLQSLFMFRLIQTLDQVFTGVMRRKSDKSRPTEQDQDKGRSKKTEST